MKEVNHMEEGGKPSVQNPPVYLSFKTLQSAIASLREHGLPNKLDRSAWGSRSGMDQTQILSAFRFLGFVDQQSNTQEPLRNLVAVKENTEEEKKESDMPRYSILTLRLPPLSSSMRQLEHMGREERPGIEPFDFSSRRRSIAESNFQSGSRKRWGRGVLPTRKEKIILRHPGKRR
jgi:hypothetical protein